MMVEEEPFIRRAVLSRYLIAASSTTRAEEPVVVSTPLLAI
jgi:hypothetical protein